MAERDGDGWARCDQGHLHWGRFGAVGLLGYGGYRGYRGYGGDGDDVRVLLARRSRWSQHGGSWGPPGGARDSDEDPVDAALREAAEECGLPPGGVRIEAMLLDDHGGWSYRTYVAAAAELFPVRAASPEISEARWVPAAEVASLPLHPGFARHWPALSRSLVPVTIIVDVANVMGARPDGWWRDRAGAALRLHAQLVSLAGRGIAALPGALGLPRLDLWLPDFVLVAEGAARGAGFGRDDRVRVVTAPGSGDDTIAAQARALPGRRLVVTADRELRRRCEAAGAVVTGPGWLLGLL